METRKEFLLVNRAGKGRGRVHTFAGFERSGEPTIACGKPQEASHHDAVGFSGPLRSPAERCGNFALRCDMAVTQPHGGRDARNRNCAKVRASERKRRPRDRIIDPRVSILTCKIAARGARAGSNAGKFNFGAIQSRVGSLRSRLECPRIRAFPGTPATPPPSLLAAPPHPSRNGSKSAKRAGIPKLVPASVYVRLPGAGHARRTFSDSVS